ncbi:transmembrane protein, putative [Medicago truncatula]|uniref:Transmembrane protein, putative n=1 Tax=Medicago truncatula TaxID=3880 RepID=A0A072TRS8_MEDTR|nr:transmembrane protein, putative [Medicago truncatula]
MRHPICGFSLGVTRVRWFCRLNVVHSRERTKTAYKKEELVVGITMASKVLPPSLKRIVKCDPIDVVNKSTFDDLGSRKVVTSLSFFPLFSILASLLTFTPTLFFTFSYHHLDFPYCCMIKLFRQSFYCLKHIPKIWDEFLDQEIEQL